MSTDLEKNTWREQHLKPIEGGWGSEMDASIIAAKKQPHKQRQAALTWPKPKMPNDKYESLLPHALVTHGIVRGMNLPLLGSDISTCHVIKSGPI